MILSHPFRIGRNGAAVVVDEGDTRAHAEAVAIIAGTRRGERGMCPNFGVTDPAFGALDVGEVAANLAQFGPRGVTVTGVATTPLTDTTARVVLTFDEE